MSSDKSSGNRFLVGLILAVIISGIVIIAGILLFRNYKTVTAKLDVANYCALVGRDCSTYLDTLNIPAAQLCSDTWDAMRFPAMYGECLITNNVLPAE